MEKINVMTCVLDDNEIILKLIEKGLQNAGMKYQLFKNEVEFLDAINDDVHIAIIDYCLTGKMTGLDILRLLKKKNPRCYVIVMSGQECRQVVIDFINSGVWRYVDKQANYISQVVLFVEQAAAMVQDNLCFYNTLISKSKNSRYASDTNAAVPLGLA